MEHLRERLDEVAARAFSVEGLQPTTLARWKVSRQSFLRFMRDRGCGQRFVGGDYRVQAILIEDWIAWLRERGNARATIATYFHSLSAQVARIEREDGMLSPLSLLDAPKAGRALPRSLTKRQAEELLSLVRNESGTTLSRTRNLCVVGLMLLAGLRRGEVLAIEVADCDVERRTLVVRHGKGRNGGAPRTSYMTSQLAVMLANYAQERDCAQPARTHAALLTSTVGNAPLTVDGLRKLFMRWSTALGYRVTPHMLRHTYALLLRQAGVPDRVSMDLLGHHSLSMLQRYSHVFDGEHRDEAAKVFLDL
ncbi:MAG: tyrosine-type recombinase/integrase [Acidobacteriota bacterium]